MICRKFFLSFGFYSNLIFIASEIAWSKESLRRFASFSLHTKKPTEGPNRRNKGYHHCKVNSLGDQFTVRCSRPYFSECWMLFKNLYRSRWSKNITPWKLHPDHSWAILLCKSTLVNMSGWGNLIPRVLSLPPSRKEGEPWKRSCGWGSELRACALAFHQCGLGLL